MAAGRHFFAEDPMVFFRFRIAEVPERFVKLAELGYSRESCREMIRNQRGEIHWRRVAQLFLREPWATVRVSLRHLRASLALRSGRDRWYLLNPFGAAGR